MTDTSPETTGLHHVTNICTDMEETREFYEDVLGFHTVKMTENYDDPGTLHYYFSSTPEGEPGTVISYFEYPGNRGTPGGGASHHFAMGVEDEATLREWRDHFREQGVRVSDVKDRTYFKSIYVSDPDGLVIEFATRGPGMTVDEDVPGSEFVDPSAN
jgi:glyoxalase family protein